MVNIETGVQMPANRQRSNTRRAKSPETEPLSAEEGIRQGLEDATNGRLCNAEEFFRQFEATHGIKSEL